MTSVLDSYASTKDWIKYDWDLEFTLSHLPSRLQTAAKPFDREELIFIFNKLETMKPYEEKQHKENEDSTDSEHSLEIYSTEEYLKAIEEGIHVYFTKTTDTQRQLVNRQSFITVLSEIEKEIDSIVFKKGMELIALRFEG